MIRNKFQQEKKNIRETFHKGTSNFVGIGIGDASESGDAVENCVCILVSKKDGSHKDGMHTFEDGSQVPVKYIEVGKIRTTGFSGRYRPAQPGAMIGALGAPVDGTFGALVTDNTDGKKVILSCNHVLADWGNLPIDTPTLQPGANHGGTNPADAIGSLKRVVPVDWNQYGVNYVDAAIAKVSSTNLVNATPFCAAVKPTKQGAIGLMWAASPVITIVSPMSNVLSLLNVSVPKVKTATVGMSIHACCAATGYVATTVSQVMVDLLIASDYGTDVWFMDQTILVGGIADGEGGDSGSVFYTTFNV